MGNSGITHAAALLWSCSFKRQCVSRPGGQITWFHSCLVELGQLLNFIVPQFPVCELLMIQDQPHSFAVSISWVTGLNVGSSTQDTLVAEDDKGQDDSVWEKPGGEYHLSPSRCAQISVAKKGLCTHLTFTPRLEVILGCFPHLETPALSGPASRFLEHLFASANSL